uniref:CCHC-type domain-containing protein n=1 Tax=Alexandrium monilatum TaxID=311494 RepID=A0A7S4UQE8_9DINO|mmetsp:Transcript_5878/g.17510  ORF Transcript_5878/g.17510 Transcript_5878/m.17510 type:complete len:657 (-) Transcript_5878:342-2312(-)
MAAFKVCRLCDEVGHLAHYCPDRERGEPSHAGAAWLACLDGSEEGELVEELQRLIAGNGWLSRVRLLCRLCKRRPELLKAANDWRGEGGHSLLSLAVSLNLRNTIQMLWAAGIHCGIKHDNPDSYFILMKMCDARHRERKYDWFTGKSDFAARLEREGGMLDAFIRVSLIWNCADDLDLHVICPSGEEICFSHKQSRCGGELDVDMNASAPYSHAPVENIVWAGNEVPAGEYRVIVNNYCHRSRQQVVPFAVEVAVQGKPAVRIDGSWRVEDGQMNRARVHVFTYDPTEVQPEDGEEEAEEAEGRDEAQEDAHLPTVANMNHFTGGDANSSSGSNDKLAQLAWLTLRSRDAALLDTLLALGLHDAEKLGRDSCVSPQWCFLQALWAQNLPAAQRLLHVCGRAIDINHAYRWDVIPWCETVAQVCWRECHGDEVRDRSWMKALSWLAIQGADFSHVKLNFHRWRKPSAMQESQIRTFNRLIWHLSDENGWRSNSRAATDYLRRTVRRLVAWGAHVPEDLDPDFQGKVEWGVNGRRPEGVASHCYGKLNVELVHSAVRSGKSNCRAVVLSVLCSLTRTQPAMHSGLRRHILCFLYPHLGRGRMSYAALQKSEGGRVRDPENVRVECSETSEPPRGYVCGRCRRAGHWRKFCPRGQGVA